MPNWGFVVIDNSTSTAAAGFYRGAALEPPTPPITRSDECVAYPIDSSSTSVTSADAGAVTITGSVEARLTSPAYAWTGTAPISSAGERVAVIVQGTPEVPAVRGDFVTPYSIQIASPTLADGFAMDSASPLTVQWTPSDCRVGLRLANAEVSLQCAWAGTNTTATIPPQLLGLLANSTSPVTLSIDCASWVHPTASDWSFTMSLHTFYQEFAVTVE
jgi:hypothetical protein